MAGTNSMNTTENRRYAEQLTQWFSSIPPGKQDWAEALLCAAIDEHKGDKISALESAKQAFEQDPDGE